MPSPFKSNADRRKVLPGFPIVDPFTSIEDVRKYLSGETMVCLLCGKSYKRIGTHLLAIHGLAVDEYKRRYDIPWTYGLICKESSKKYSKAVKKRMSDGWKPPIKVGDGHKKMISIAKRKCPFKSEVAKQNLSHSKGGGKPTHPLTKAPDGSLETFTQKRERLTTKRGTPEFIEKMKNRAQCLPENVKKSGFDKYWLGKKQSESHKSKRFKNRTTKTEF